MINAGDLDSWILSSIESLGANVAPPLLLALIAGVLVVEAGCLVGLAIPGSTIVLGLGVLSGLEVVSVGSAIATAAAATSCGCQYSFIAARRRGRAIARTGPKLFANKIASALARAQALSARHPQAVALAGPLVGGIRTLAPRFVASSNISYAWFSALTLVAVTCWAALLVSIGGVLGADDDVRTAVGSIGVPVVVLVALVRRWLSKRRREPGPPEQARDQTRINAAFAA
ncbi:DedA family protein [Antrihabitans sp. YC2-6]|uniref:DedA family protein n=1 Tax=Antrihabitans sp. YC2-6 TaxID=2799498 RepID=UPI0018F2BCA4|nr:hypothetical protein [Antrihabitans sp. YC2-6]MBJ8347247.1 hypothetical protein [Antrihabitans sp. YC2-6]